MTDFIFLCSKITADGDCCHEIKRHCLLGRKSVTNLDSIIKKQRHYFSNKGSSSQSFGFSSSHVWMWELDHKESCAPKNWCFWTVVLGKTLKNLLDCKEIQPVHPKRNQSWIFIGRTDTEAEAPKFCTLVTWCEELTHLKRPWCWKRLKAGRERNDRGWDGLMASLAGWNEFEQSSGVGDGQGSLLCCSPRGHKNQTQLSNWTELNECPESITVSQSQIIGCAL